MEEDWETLADKDESIPSKPKDINKWEGEDDDDDVMESWEDEEEKKDAEKSDKSQKEQTAATASTKSKKKPNKALIEKLAQQERLAALEEEERLANMTPEEKLAEKLRIQKIQEESDLKSALETFGVSSIGNSLDEFNPQTKEEFKEFGATLSLKLAQYKESAHYPQFIEDLVRSICLNLSSSDMKKVKISIESLHTEKLKMEKQNAKKPAAKGKGKVTLRTENDDIDVYQKYGNDYGADYDDFM